MATPKAVIARNLLAVLLAASPVIANMATLQAAATSWKQACCWLSFMVCMSRCQQASIFCFVRYLNLSHSCGEPFLRKESTGFIPLTSKEVCSVNITIWYQTCPSIVTDFTPISGCFHFLNSARSGELSTYQARNRFHTASNSRGTFCIEIAVSVSYASIACHSLSLTLSCQEIDTTITTMIIIYGHFHDYHHNYN